eukprot:482828-Amphidinium_carterae.1
MDADTVYENSECEQEAYDYTDFPQITALIGFDLERGYHAMQYGRGTGAILNTVDVHTMTTQHFNDAGMTEQPDTLLPPEEL